jgi:hypothetical protein
MIQCRRRKVAMVRATFCTLSMAVEQSRGRGARSRGERGSSHRRLEKYLQEREKGRERERRQYNWSNYLRI